jgi:uncharacterized membrane protein
MTTRRYALTGVLVVAVGALVRLAAASNEIWLDEVWSLRIATDIGSVWQAFTIKHDNNHVLNTVYLHWVGLRDAWVVYRLPAVLAGTGAVALVLLCERGARRTEALATAALMAVSYPLVLYSAEARGYAPALLAALVSFYALERHWEAPRLATLLVFWAATVLGTLFHATYVPAYVALLGWSVVRAIEVHGFTGRALRALTTCHLLPLAFVVAFYLLFLRGMVIGGGPGYRTLDVVRESAAYTLGVPQAWSAIALAMAVVLGVSGLGLLVGQRSPRWTFFVLVLVVVPALMLLVTRPKVLYFRYFLVQTLFFYSLAGTVLGALSARGASGRVAAWALMAVYGAAQLPPLHALLTTGRGGCVETVRYLGNHTSGPVVSVGADDDFRNGLMLWYLERFLPAGKRLQYVAQSAAANPPPDWVLLHDLGPPTPHPDTIQSPSGARYDRVAGFQCGGVARWYWWVYRHAG